MSDNRTIKTPVATYGHMDLVGNSSLSALPAIFTLYHTAKRTETGYAMQTDAKGLKALASLGSSAANAIGSALTAIGELLVYAEDNEVNGQSYKDLGWLLVALGELGMDLENARSLIDNNLRGPTPPEAPAKPAKAHEGKLTSVSFSDEEWSVVQEYAAEHGLSEADAVQQLAVAGLAARAARAGEARPEAPAA